MVEKSGDELRERMADLCHEQWAHWMKYLFSKGVPDSLGGVFLPPGSVDRWLRQMKTPYSQLSKKEKDSDRAEADKFLKLLENHFEEHFRGK